MRVVVDHLTDAEVRIVSAVYGRGPSSYALADLALYKFVQACVAASAMLDEAARGVEDAVLAPSSVQHRTDVFSGGGEE